MARIQCHAEKQSDILSMPRHIERIGVYEKDGSLKVFPDNYEIEKKRGLPMHPQIKYPELRKWNRGGGASAKDFIKSWQEAIKGLERKPQVNASPTVYFHLGAPEEFWIQLRKDYPKDEDYYAKCEEFFQECRVALDELYPFGKTLKWGTHYEETVPHMHDLRIPILKAPRRLSTKAKAMNKKLGKDVLKFSSGEFLGGPIGLENLQTFIYEKVGKKWGLERGERGSEKKHTNQLEWQRELCIKEREVTEGLKINNEIREKFIQDSEELLANESELEAEKERFKNEREAEVEKLTAQKAEIMNLETEVLAEKEGIINESKKEAQDIKDAAFIKGNEIINSANTYSEKERMKLNNDQKEILAVINTDLNKIEVPKLEKHETGIKFSDRITSWLKATAYKLTKREKELEERETALNEKEKAVEHQLYVLTGGYGEENKLKLAIRLLIEKLKKLQKSKNEERTAEQNIKTDRGAKLV